MPNQPPQGGTAGYGCKRTADDRTQKQHANRTRPRRGFPRNTPSLFLRTTGSVTSYRLWKYRTHSEQSSTIRQPIAVSGTLPVALMSVCLLSASWPCERQPPLKGDRQVPVILPPPPPPICHSKRSFSAALSLLTNTPRKSFVALLQPANYDELVITVVTPSPPPPSRLARLSSVICLELPGALLAVKEINLSHPVPGYQSCQRAAMPLSGTVPDGR